MEWTAALGGQVDAAVARALGEHDANPYSATAGCFDRRFWAWKLVDFPEATFQRLVYPIALCWANPSSRFHRSAEAVNAVRAGLAFAARVQHANGSFDQAFPFEQSYGATAFLAFPLLEAARILGEDLPAADRARVDDTVRRSADFLCERAEEHGVISNHLAGGALSLVAAADHFHDSRYDDAARKLVDGILDRQSAEGWYPEYDGADPGYQTLCVDYLSAVAARRDWPRLGESLAKAVGFLQWFAHPDGTLGGIYGSRRTSLTYLAGLARLASTQPAAAAMCELIGAGMAAGVVAGPASMDAGNLAPMLSSTAAALPLLKTGMGDPATLPQATPGTRADFPAAGLYVRGSARAYVIVGASNGGTVTMFDRQARRLLLDDGGYVAELADGRRVTSQSRGASARLDGDTLQVETGFAAMASELPTPARFLLLRALNITLMRSIAIGNWVKRRLVELLMTTGAEAPLRLTRRVTVDDVGTRIDDRLENPQGLALKWLRGGRPFSAIHMASAGYFHAARTGTAAPPREVDVEQLASHRAVNVNTTV